ncbi:hypothetical protein K466DRAFT_38122 [Polyporus arcularius HHB13444]|nr:hypothetical protein K466DRAFT_38122 [Polyporus arcularius HHB13444]
MTHQLRRSAPDFEPVLRAGLNRCCKSASYSPAHSDLAARQGAHLRRDVRAQCVSLRRGAPVLRNRRLTMRRRAQVLAQLCADGREGRVGLRRCASVWRNTTKMRYP